MSAHPAWNSALGKLVCPVCAERHTGTAGYNADVLGHAPSEEQASRWLPPGTVPEPRYRERPWPAITVGCALAVLVTLGTVDASRRLALIPVAGLLLVLSALMVRARRA